MYIVRFEMVSPVDHPEYYQNESPLCAVQDVLPGHWKAVAVTHREQTDAVEQFQGLKDLCRLGELIRNVKIRPVIDVDWKEVDDQLAREYEELKAEVADAQTYQDGSGRQDQHHHPEQAGS